MTSERTQHGSSSAPVWSPTGSPPGDAPAETSHGLTVVVPAFNEENAIGSVLARLQQTLSVVGSPFEILVVDDGSHDGTAASAATFEHVVVHRHEDNRGYGAALKTGIHHAAFEYICITDADGTYPIEEIPRLIEALNDLDSDMVVASRRGPNAKHPVTRRPAKFFIRHLANFVAGVNIPDPNSGLRVFRRTLARRFLPLLPNGFSFTTTLSLALLTNGFTVTHLTTEYHARIGRSKIRPVRDTLTFLQLIARSALYFSPLKIFLPFSLILILLAIAWGVLSKVLFGEVADITTLLLVVTAVQIAGLGLLAQLVNRRVPNVYRD